MNNRIKHRRQETEEEDREQALEARRREIRRALGNGELTDVILKTLNEYIFHLTSKDPATLTH